MAMTVTGVGFLIHVYSTGYMHDDPRYHRFFAYLNLFVFSMLLLVLGDNLVLLYFGLGARRRVLVPADRVLVREAVGGDRREEGVHHDADRRHRDAHRHLRDLRGRRVARRSRRSTAPRRRAASRTRTATAAALLLFAGAVGKSAQLPLYVWLPDAMEGPTPVSALIHAATMVTAGVYLVVRMNPLFHVVGGRRARVVAIIGAATALYAAILAMAEDDIKRVLAYSTISQLGFMFLAAGVGAYGAAIFHLVTHAFFKALLFLAAGSVMHALGGETALDRMGGLRKAIPRTFAVTFVGWGAITGVLPFAGFFSKDAIMASVWAEGTHGPVRRRRAAALFTAFYMSRMLFLAFFGKPRWSEGTHPHESPNVDDPADGRCSPIARGHRRRARLPAAAAARRAARPLPRAGDR